MNLREIVRGAIARVNPDEEVTLIQAVGVTKPSCQAFLASDAALPVAGITRGPFARTGDFILRAGVYYLVTAVLEDWSNNGWANVELTEQIAPPDLGGPPHA